MMARNSNPKNEIIKHGYFRGLELAKGRDPATVDKVAEHLLDYEMFTGFADFSAFTDKTAEAFRQGLVIRKNAKTGAPLSKSFIVAALSSVRRFFELLSREPGFRSRIKPSHIEFLRPSLKDAQIAHAKLEAPWPTIAQSEAAFINMPVTTFRQRRDKAALALFMLTGIRITAALSLPLKAVDLIEGNVKQYGRDVATKFSKSFDTFFLPVDPVYREYFTVWVTELRKVYLFGSEDPVLPKVPSHFEIAIGDVQEKPVRAFHADGNNIRQAIKEAFVSQSMPSFRLHAFRKTLAMLGNELCQTPEELKAWSQNFGHQSIATTINDYMPVSSYRQRQIISGLAKRAFPQE